MRAPAIFEHYLFGAEPDAFPVSQLASRVAMVDEGAGHNGRSALVDLVAGKP